MLMSMSITLSGKDREGKPFTEKTRTAVINRTGAKILSKNQFQIGDKFNLSIGTSKREAATVVVWTGDRKGNEFEYGVDFEHADNNFWGVLFPDDSGSYQASAINTAVEKKAEQIAAKPPVPSPKPAIPAPQPVTAASKPNGAIKAPANTSPPVAPAPKPVESEKELAPKPPAPEKVIAPKPAAVAPPPAPPAKAPAPAASSAPPPAPPAAPVPKAPPAPALTNPPVKPPSAPAKPASSVENSASPSLTPCPNPPQNGPLPLGPAPASSGPDPMAAGARSSGQESQAQRKFAVQMPQVSAETINKLGTDLLLGVAQHLVREAFQEVLTQVIEDFERYTNVTVARAEEAAATQVADAAREAVNTAMRGALESALVTLRGQIESAAQGMIAAQTQAFEAALHGAMETADTLMQTRMHEYESHLFAKADEFCHTLARKISPGVVGPSGPRSISAA
jgi:hypothetical protein